jgi:ATP-dependent RNA helicase RhlE
VEKEGAPGPDARPAGMNRNRRRAAAHSARRDGGAGSAPAKSKATGHASHGRSGASASAPPARASHGRGGASASSSSGKPKLVGSWGSKRRR